MDLKFSKATDTKHEVKLDSYLVYAAWRVGAAFAGQSAPLEVLTAFVGNGSTIEIKGESEKGKNLGKIKDVINNNKYVGKLDVPDNAEIGDNIFFDVKISADGLSGQSNRIPVRQPIEVTNMKWSAKEARRGDVLTLSADISGVPDQTDATVTIMEYDQDKAHDKIAEIPVIVKDKKIELQWEYEYHEDTDEIPSDEEMQRYGRNYNPPEYFFVISVEGQKFGQKQESKLLLFKDYVEISLKDMGGNPRGNEQYVLHMPDGSQRRGTLDAQGYAKETGVPPGNVRVEFPNLKQVNPSVQQEG